MAKVIMTLKILPESPSVNLESLFEQVNAHVQKFSGGSQTKHEIKPLAFGLKEMFFTFIYDESIGSSDPLEENIKKVQGVRDVQVTDVRRTLG